MTSTSESTAPSARAVRRAAVIARAEAPGGAVERLEQAARLAGVEIVHGDGRTDLDLAVVLGGDGTMLRALAQFLGTGVPVIGVNFGRVGFLASIPAEELEAGLRRAFAGEFRVFELPTLETNASGRRTAVNDVVVHSGTLGRMVELAWQVGGEDFGTLACDGVICSTPSGSTAYNLSNGGPVIMWGLAAMAMTFVAPHSLNTRPLVVPRGLDLRITNRSTALPVTVLVDGHEIGELPAEGSIEVGVGEETCHLALLPGVTFFTRYHAVFP